MTIYVAKPERLAEISLDKHAMIEASAGTGKTYMLEHLIIEIMLGSGTDDRVPVEEILVVTFTERATAELKTRVRQVLEGIVMSTQTDAPEPSSDVPHWEIDDDALRFLERQLYAFDRAPIHTIHGFCHRILSENSFSLRKLFDQEHVDGNQIFENAFKRGLRTHFAKDVDLKPYLEVWLERFDLARLQNELSVVTSTSARVTPSFHEGRLADSIRAIRTAGVENQLDQLDQWLGGQMPSGHRQEKVARIGRSLEVLLKHASDDNDAWVIQSLAELDETEIENLVKWTRVSGLSSEIPLLGAAFGNLVKPRAAVLQRFAPEMRAILDDEKARGFFDFDDMLQVVWDVLKDDTDPNARALTRHLRRRFRYALIDEFQDTDPVQWNIFRTLFFDSPDHRLYVIGDPKQAIYGFRGADVHTYIEAREQLVKSDRAQKLELIENYRSSQKLIDAYNVIFDQEADPPFFSHSEIIYDHPVECGFEALAAFEAHGEEAIPIRLVRVNPIGGDLNSDRLKRSQANAIAREARRVLFDEPMRVIDRHGEERSVDPGKVFVLTRTRHEETIVAEFLRKHGVPHAFYKREGLFQTREAQYILELLIAVEQPYRLAHRLKAWATPFFEVPLHRLPYCRDLPETHPLFERLVSWHEMATHREFDQLFNSILDESGIVRREIFLKKSERELTNYQHIFEVLQEEASRSNLELGELIMRLRGFIDDTRFPQTEEDKNVQRLESERQAVQIMTMHKSKGLQADLVFVFGGFSKPPSAAFHNLYWNKRRLLHIGDPYLEMAAKAAREGSIYEDERLLYVAITRARYRVYLPYLEKEDYGYLDHTYKRLNDRLRDLVSSGVVDSHPGFESVLVEEVDDVPEVAPRGGGSPDIRYQPGEEITQEDALDEHYASVRGRPQIVTSYSRMKAQSGGYKASSSELVNDDIHAEVSSWRADDALPGGTGPGIFVHTVIEELDFAPMRETPYETWAKDPEIDRLFTDLMRRHGIDRTHLDAAKTLVYRSLTMPLELPDGSVMKDGVVGVERELREMEFLFPIPESAHSRLDHELAPPFEVKRGYVKGYIDYLFEHNGKVYFADWKTDTLESYAADFLTEHVARNYGTQAKLYALAVLKHFRIHTEEQYEVRFGGYAYFFLRGMARTHGEGLYIKRARWSDLVDYEASLVEAELL